MNTHSISLRTVASLIIFVTCAAFPRETRAQQARPDTTVKTASSFDADSFLRKLPPVEVLIDSAIAQAPDIRGQEISVRQSRLEVRRARTSWTSDMVNAGGIVNYGKLNDLYLADNSGAGQVAATTSSQTRYSVGLTVKIPISSMFNRSDYKAAKMELEQTENRKQALINSIREEVYSRYNNLLTTYQAYQILFETFTDQEVIMQTAERDFLNNQISVADLSNIRISWAKAKVDMSNAQYEFQKSLWMLEEMTGIRIRG